MTPYFILFIFLALLAFFDSLNAKRSQRSWILFGIAVVLIFFATFRANVGFMDYDEYYSFYQEVTKTGFAKVVSVSIFEPGYIFVNYLSSFISNDPVFGFFVIALIAVSINLTCYYKYSEFFLLAVLLYFVHTFILREMMQIRAGVAAAICLYSVRYVEQRRFKRFILALVVAMSFHLASSIFLLTYWVYKLNWSKKTWTWLISISVMIGMIAPLGRLLTLFPFIGPRVDAYMWMAGTGAGLINATFIKQLFFVVIGLVFWKKLNQVAPHFNVMFVCMAMSVCWLALWNDFPIIASRLATFFSVVEVVFIPMTIYLFTSKSRPIACLAIVFYAFLTLWLNMQSSNILMYQSDLMIT